MNSNVTDYILSVSKTSGGYLFLLNSQYQTDISARQIAVALTAEVSGGSGFQGNVHFTLNRNGGGIVRTADTSSIRAADTLGEMFDQSVWNQNGVVGLSYRLPYSQLTSTMETDQITVQMTAEVGPGQFQTIRNTYSASKVN